MRRLALLLALSLGSILPANANSCGCDSTLTLPQHLEQSNVTILGTVISIATNPIKGGLNIVFDVDSSWKRAIEPVATIHTNFTGQCGFPFEEGKKYVVFARKRHQTVATSICEPNMAFEEGGEGLVRRLGQGFAPGRPEMAIRFNWILVGLGVGGLLLVAFVVLRKKIKPAR